MKPGRMMPGGMNMQAMMKQMSGKNAKKLMRGMGKKGRGMNPFGF